MSGSVAEQRVRSSASCDAGDAGDALCHCPPWCRPDWNVPRPEHRGTPKLEEQGAEEREKKKQRKEEKQQE